MEVVEVLPFLKLVVEHVGVVDDDTVFEHPVELLGVDPVRSLHLAVQPRCSGLDVDVADASVEDVPVELGLELGAVVGLDLFDLEWELLQDVVEELDRGGLVVARVDPQHSQAGAVVDRGVLVVLLRSSSSDGLDELHVDLDLMARQRLLVALRAGRRSCDAGSPATGSTRDV